MTSELHLYLRGTYFFKNEIELPNYDENLCFQNNCLIRESFINYKKGVLRLLYLRQILKCEGDYEIYLVTKSRATH
jgi:hypothetical protein